MTEKWWDPRDAIKMQLICFIIVLPFAFILSIDFSEDDDYCPGNGTGELSVEHSNCQLRLSGSLGGEVGNQSIDGKDYRIYQWYIVEGWDYEYTSTAAYARLDFRTNSMSTNGHYSTYFECKHSQKGILGCETDREIDGKDWISVNAQEIDWNKGGSNSTTIFVNIEKGEPILIAIEKDIEVSERSELQIELIA